MKNLKNLGKALTKAEQKTINGGKGDPNPPGPLLACYTITYGWWTTEPDCDSCMPQFHTSQTYDPTNYGMQPYSFSAIIPTPAGC